MQSFTCETNALFNLGQFEADFKKRKTGEFMRETHCTSWMPKNCKKKVKIQTLFPKSEKDY